MTPEMFDQSLRDLVAQFDRSLRDLVAQLEQGSPNVRLDLKGTMVFTQPESSPTVSDDKPTKIEGL